MPFNIDDQVRKVTGDYKIKGEVRGVFTMKNGAVRYAVEHTIKDEDGEGSFLHIYSEKNLELIEPSTSGTATHSIDVC